MAKNPGRIKPLSETADTKDTGDALVLNSQVIKVATGEVIHRAFTLDGASAGTYEFVAQVAAGGRLSITLTGSLAPSVVIKIITRLHGAGEINIARTPKCLGAQAALELITVGVLEQKANVQVSDALRELHSGATGIVRSRLVFKDQASGAVRAYLRVKPETRGIVVHEDLRALILGSSNRVQCLPELRIETKDCVATHLSSLARPEARQLQYLAAHGLAKPQAEAVICAAFLQSL